MVNEFMDEAYYFSRNNLLEALGVKIMPLDVGRISAAYEIAENAHQKPHLNYKTPYFYHLSRISEILIKELKIFNADLIICSLLKDIYLSGDEITHEILDYNFGKYVASFIDYYYKFCKDSCGIQSDIEIKSFDDEKIILKSDDFLIIHLADCLDDLRYQQFNPLTNPITHVITHCDNLISEARESFNHSVKYLVEEIQKERNKIIG